MTKPKYECKCHPESPFLWHKNPRPSIFLKDKSAQRSQRSSDSQKAVVERKRLDGVDISHIGGMTIRTDVDRRDPRRFAVYSKAVRSSQ